MNKSYVKLFIAGGLLLTATSAGVVIMPTSVSADDVVDEVNLTIPTACTMGGTIAQGDEHTVSLEPGTYRPNIGKTTMTTFCNDPGGFSIYAIGFTGEEYTGDNHTKLVGTTASNTISTGLTTGSNYTDESSWAMKLTAVDGIYSPTIMNGEDDTEDFTNYHVVPDTYTKVATFDTVTDAELHSGLGSRFETTYAVYAGITQAADTYNGKVKYTLVHPATETPLAPQTTQTGKICYYANAKDAVGTMGCQNVASSITLLASNFSRDGYGFAGWSDKFNYQTNTSAKFYGPNETITLNTADYTGDNNGLSLYAVWVKSQGSIQDTTKVAELCGTGANALTTAPTDGTANLASVSALTDQRDNETYAIARLADGNCWMIENLRLDNSASLTLANTNNPLNDGTNVTLKHSYSDTETHNTLSASQDLTATAWCQSNSASCDDQSMLFTGNTTNRKTNSVDNSGNIYSYGNYYNWYSATAGRGTYSFGTNNNSVAGDLCPAGWHLPIGGRKANVDVSDFWKLSRATIGADPANFANDYFYYTGTPEGTDASNKMRAYPNNFVYSGSVRGGSVNDRGSYGYFWSSTAYSYYNAYNLDLYSSYVLPGTFSYNKYGGRTVRCVAPGA